MFASHLNAYLVLTAVAIFAAGTWAKPMQEVLIQAEKSESTPWNTPSYLIGECSTVWTSAFADYKLPYTVLFGDSGFYRWWSPLKSGDSTEIGVGMYLSPPVTEIKNDGSWETHYFGANHFTPDASDSTNCCCEYIGGKGASHPRILADYCVATVPHSAHRPMAEVCLPYLQACPANNATAFQMMGQPFVEIYETCGPRVVVWQSPLWLLFFTLGLLLLGMWQLLLRWRVQGNGLLVEVDQKANDYQRMEDQKDEPNLQQTTSQSTIFAESTCSRSCTETTSSAL